MEIVTRLFHEQKRKAPVGSLFQPSVSGAPLASLRENDVVVKRPTSRTHVIETILSNWLRCNLSKVRMEPIAELLRQLRMLPLEYASSVFFAMTKRIQPVCRPFFKFLFYCVSEYLPDHGKMFDRVIRRVKKKTTQACKAGT
jgi:hypothetical protein